MRVVRCGAVRCGVVRCVLCSVWCWVRGVRWCVEYGCVEVVVVVVVLLLLVGVRGGNGVDGGGRYGRAVGVEVAAE